LTRRARFQQRLLGPRLGARVAVSEEVATRLQILFGWSREKIAVVHNGIPHGMYTVPPDPQLRAELLRGERALLLIPARLDPLKGHEFALEALRRLDGVQAIFAGDGPDRERLEALTEELGLRPRVTFLGFRDDLPRLLACTDVAVLPSLSEGLPLAALEALAAGTPLVATSVGGTGEAVVDGVTGLLVPPRDPDALAAAIRRVLSDPFEARIRAEAGIERVRSLFCAERMVESIETLYGELLIRRERHAAA
jgi:glycosyltransferase involved in cell wall biosynthesis